MSDAREVRWQRRGARRWCIGLATTLALIAAPESAIAQAVRGTLLGGVTDNTGLAVPGVTVRITEVNTNITTSGVTNESGNYIFSNISDGTYRVEAELTGFKKFLRDGVRVDVNTTVRVDIRLDVGTLEETVTVEGASPALQTDRTDTGRLIESKLIQEVPLGFNRNFQATLVLVPGAIRPFRPHSEFFNPQDTLSTMVNGQSRLANNVQLEGVDNNHKTGLLTVLIPSAESIETVNVTTSNYDAEFGRAGGAVTNVTLKSGTNRLAGSLFAFGNTEATIARSYFVPKQKAPTEYLQGGFTLGGPVVRNRLFYFGDYQHTIDNSGRVQRATVPTAAFRDGDLSAAPTTVFDPATGSASGSGRQPFAGNIIPANRISPIAREILRHVPLPNIDDAPLGQANWQQPYVREKTTEAFNVKINFHANATNAFSARFSFQRPEILDPGTFGIYGGGGKGFAGTGTNLTISSGATWTRTWNPTFVMEVRGGVSYYHNEALSQAHGLKTADEVGIRGANLNEFSSGVTSIDIGGFSSPLVGFSASLPWDRSERTTSIATIFNKVRGNHTIKFGGELRHNRDFLLQVQDAGGPRGEFEFRGAQTAVPGNTAAQAGFANAFAAFLLDTPARVMRDLITDVDPGTQHWAVFTFIHDKWQVGSNVTIDLGLRHEYYTPLFGLTSRGGLSNYDPAANALRVAGYGGVSKSVGVKSYWKNWAPRMGISWRPTERDVVRAGYGVSTIPFPDNSYAFNFPVKQNNQFNPVNTFASVGSMAAGFPAPIFFDIPSDGIIPADQFRNTRLFSVPADLHEGSLHSWNLAYQRELPWGLVGEIAYIGNRGVDIIAGLNANAGLVLGADRAGQPLFQNFGRQAETTTWVPKKTDYHSMQAKVDRKFRNGLLLTTSYTVGRARSYSGGDSNGGISTPADHERSWARTDRDRTHIYAQSFVWELPFGRNKRWASSGPLMWVLGDWQLAGIFNAATGEPINFTASAATLRAPGNTQRPDASGTPRVIGDIGPGAFYFDTSVFSAPAQNTWGNVRRNSLLDGPGYWILDMAVAKWLRWGSRQLEIRADGFNILNHPQYGNPGGGFGSSTFGRVTGVGGQRQIRFGARFLF